MFEDICLLKIPTGEEEDCVEDMEEGDEMQNLDVEDEVAASFEDSEGVALGVEEECMEEAAAAEAEAAAGEEAAVDQAAGEGGAAVKEETPDTTAATVVKKEVPTRYPTLYRNRLT